MVLRKDQIRLYPGRDGVGVGSKGQAETFFEVDLSTIDAEYAALLPLVFSATALTRDGTADELLRDSARYATELGARLRERIYDEIVPPVAVEVAERLARDAGVELDADGLSTAYRVTLRILFRLLFQAYAEDRGLLPSGRNEGFDANSLKTNARRLLDSGTEEFGDASTIWFDLVQVWNAIDQGNPQWQIPAYNGGLFATDPDRSPEGALIKKIELPDSVLGPALKSLLIDVSEDGVLGPVDFRSLSVREFGTIYEGLLESSLSLAEYDLTVDSSGAWVPAGRVTRSGRQPARSTSTPHLVSGRRPARTSRRRSSSTTSSNARSSPHSPLTWRRSPDTSRRVTPPLQRAISSTFGSPTSPWVRGTSSLPRSTRSKRSCAPSSPSTRCPVSPRSCSGWRAWPETHLEPTTSPRARSTRSVCCAARSHDDASTASTSTRWPSNSPVSPCGFTRSCRACQ